MALAETLLADNQAAWDEEENELMLRYFWQPLK